ncbi:hypothetical protein L6164_035408 [Bauhinia variegata]|uniref:Uncharacterized protein n=1 Tax=Bauhinia variegata TaxID=167791 RepID=A0ACB9KDX1_BAUVA|nr:hypothetical protein L6164_035408 [Bauhinia variegata]
MSRIHRHGLLTVARHKGICCDQGLHLPNAMSFTSWRFSRLIPSDERGFWGWTFLSVGSVFFFGFFAAVISKLLPRSDVAIIAAIQNDWYYCFLVPLTLPVVMVAVYFHWLSMKMFKHA